ncbi:hypothetical protein RISK_006785 [Rhodopirellula islandica]|uniref:Uncharacterized protein n=1 Tax=Rhodopirellula islandica TaxID=595434 RepID=A0A0J1B403_RHOIS|nr:hypothetical protein RISK_006785 [Rhodopirellula islandica]
MVGVSDTSLVPWRSQRTIARPRPNSCHGKLASDSGTDCHDFSEQYY